MNKLIMSLLVLILSNQAFALTTDSGTTKSSEGGASQAQPIFTLEEIIGVCNIIR